MRVVIIHTHLYYYLYMHMYVQTCLGPLVISVTAVLWPYSYCHTVLLAVVRVRPGAQLYRPPHIATHSSNVIAQYIPRYILCIFYFYLYLFYFVMFCGVAMFACWRHSMYAHLLACLSYAGICAAARARSICIATHSTVTCSTC